MMQQNRPLLRPLQLEGGEKNIFPSRVKKQVIEKAEILCSECFGTKLKRVKL